MLIGSALLLKWHTIKKFRNILCFVFVCVCARMRMERQRPSAMDSGILKVNNDIIDQYHLGNKMLQCKDEKIYDEYLHNESQRIYIIYRALTSKPITVNVDGCANIHVQWDQLLLCFNWRGANEDYNQNDNSMNHIEMLEWNSLNRLCKLAGHNWMFFKLSYRLSA